jgi:hypothetical protein
MCPHFFFLHWNQTRRFSLVFHSLDTLSVEFGLDQTLAKANLKKKKDVTVTLINDPHVFL